jgi:hypothetical protein
MKLLNLCICAVSISINLAATALAAKCKAPPLPLPYRRLSALPGTPVEGIQVRIGSPPQYVTLTPSLMLDNTFIPRYTNSCISLAATQTNTTDPQDQAKRRDEHLDLEADGLEGLGGYLICSEIYGGGYNPELSKTWAEKPTTMANAEVVFQKSNFAEWKFMDETFAFSDYLEVYAEAMDALPDKRNLTTGFILPNEQAVFGQLGDSTLGLTPNSTLLSSLDKEGMVASTSWSLTNSTLCLGCIDKSWHSSTFKTFKPADRKADDKLPCLLQAKVEQLFWYPKSGSEGTFLVKEGFTACIDPGVKFLVLPEEAREGIGKATEREVVQEYDDQLVLKGKPGREDGILNFRLEGDFVVNVTVPGSGNPDGEDNEDGVWKLPFGKGGWGAYGDGVLTLGKPFTDRVVLQWDSNAQEYAMANVNGDPKKEDEDMIPLGCDDFPEKAERSHSAPVAGIIAGSITGGFVGGALFVMGCLFFYKRGGQKVKSKYRSMPSEEAFQPIPLGSLGGDRRTISSRASAAPSAHTAYSSHSYTSPMMEVEDSAIYEAAEGGSAGQSPREREGNGPGYPSTYQR